MLDAFAAHKITQSKLMENEKEIEKIAQPILEEIEQLIRVSAENGYYKCAYDSNIRYSEEDHGLVNFIAKVLRAKNFLVKEYILYSRRLEISWEHLTTSGGCRDATSSRSE